LKGKGRVRVFSWKGAGIEFLALIPCQQFCLLLLSLYFSIQPIQINRNNLHPILDYTHIMPSIVLLP